MKPVPARSLRRLLAAAATVWLAGTFPGAPLAQTKSELPPDVKALVRAALAAERDGNLRAAERSYEQALALARTRRDAAAEARVLRHRGLTALHQHDFQSAVADLTESIRLYEAAGDAAGAALSRLELVAPLDASGQQARADEELRAAETTLATVGDGNERSFAALVQARRLIDRGEFAAALARIEAAEAFYRTVDKPGRLADALSLKAYVLQHLEQWQPSKEAYAALLELAFRLGNQQQIAYTYCNLGEIEQHLGAPGVASDLLDRSIDLFDRLRANILGAPEDRLAFLDTQVDAYHRKIALLVDGKQHAEAFDLAERFHARAFLESLDVPSPGERPLPRDELSNARKLAELQSRLLSTGLSEDERGALRAAEERWAVFERGSRRDQPSQRTGAQERVTLDELRGRVPSGTALLAYWVHPRGTFLWVVRSQSVQTIQIPVAAAALDELTRRYLAPIRDRTVAEDVALRGKAAEHLAAGAELQRLLIAPAAAQLEGVERIVIVPDAFLWYLPFEALVSEVKAAPAAQPAPFFWEYSQAKYLNDSYRIVYAPSATAWVRLAAAGRGGRGLLSLAPASSATLPGSSARSLPPLPSSRAESATLAALFPGARALAGADASEAEFRRAAESARFVHFAAHGYLHRTQPDLSGLLLAPGAGVKDANAPAADDGLLQAHEIKRLRYRGELISVAACNSALGQFSRGEGLLGVGRAFLTSGARNVVVSLWRVNDATGASLMQRFYSGVAREQGLSAALQSAKRSLRGETGRGTVVLGNEEISYAHPYFWAGFVQIGAD